MNKLKIKLRNKDMMIDKLSAINTTREKFVKRQEKYYAWSIILLSACCVILSFCIWSM